MFIINTGLKIHCCENKYEAEIGSGLKLFYTKILLYLYISNKNIKSTCQRESFRYMLPIVDARDLSIKIPYIY